MSLYQYSPLRPGEIRLVVLLPGNFNDDIDLKIFHESLPRDNQVQFRQASPRDLEDTLPDNWRVRKTLQGRYLFYHRYEDYSSWDHPNPNIDRTLFCSEPHHYQSGYEALSYAWGFQTDTVRAHVSKDASPSTYLEIRHNLACALRHLRFANESRVLWVDAICINQKDLDERNAQVKRMTRIYSSAARVVIWLGDDFRSPDSIQAIKAMDYIAAQVECSIDGYTINSPEAVYPTLWNRNSPLDFDHKTWETIESIFRLPWFSRVWVFQEAHLSNSHTIVHYGHHTISWYALQKALTVLRFNISTPPALSNRLQMMRLAFNPGKPYFTMPRLLQASRGLESSDERDKLYGVLSLAPPSVRVGVVPRYTLSIKDVYLQAFHAEINTTKRIDLLADCRLDQAIPSFPTWLPNWTTKVDSFPAFDAHRFQRMPAGLSCCHVQFSHGYATFCGIEAAEIQKVGTMANGDCTNLQQTFRSWEPKNLHMAMYPAGGSLFTAYLEVIFFGCLRDRFHENGDWITLAEARSSYEAFMSETSSSIYMPLGVSLYDKVALLETSEGYIGLGPAACQPGDRVCIILGCNAAPIILRPTESGEYLVVGPCFVHGMMDAEVVLGHLPPSWTVQWERVNGFGVPHFYNKEAQELSSEDPRLPPLPVKWQHIEVPRTKDNPEIFSAFKNVETGEVLDSDPRLLPGALEQRGIQLNNFCLI